MKRQREHLMQAARGGTRALGMFVLILQLVGSDHLWNSIGGAYCALCVQSFYRTIPKLHSGA